MGYNIFPDGKYGEASEAVYKEIIQAKQKFPPFNSMHEGYAVILEELDEAWDQIKADNTEKACAEMRQVAAMATAFLAEFGKYPYNQSTKHSKHVPMVGPAHHQGR